MNTVPSTQMTVLSPIKENPGLHLRDTSLPGGIGNCVSVSISFHPNGKLLQDSAGKCSIEFEIAIGYWLLVTCLV